MPGIQRVGTVSYAGWSFPPAINAKVRSQPVYDSSRRTIKYRAYTVTIDCVITNEDLGGSTGVTLPTDDRVGGLRALLQKPGLTFVFNGQGFGNDLTVTSQDCIGYGPLPGELLWEPIGSSQAFRLVWSVTFEIIECCDDNQDLSVACSRRAINLQNRAAEFNWSVSFGINDSGMTTRTVTGIMEISVYRRANDYRRIDISADQAREAISFPVLEGFRRQQSFNLSEDRRFIRFTITDTEIPSDNPYWPGCIRMDIQQRLSSPGMAISPKQFFTISGTIEVAPGEPRWTTWMAFHNVVKQRVENLYTALNQPKNVVNGQGETVPYDANSKPTIIYRNLTMEEDIYGRSMSFSIGYWVAGILSEKLIDASGFFKPVTVPGDWTQWTTKNVGFYGVRGYAKLGHRSSDDYIVDPCVTVSPYRPGYVKVKVGEPSLPIQLYTAKKEEAKNSWLVFHNNVEILCNPGHIRIRPTNTSGEGGKRLTEQKSIRADPSGDGKETESYGIPGVSPGSAVPAIYHDRSSNNYVLRIYGNAVRLSYPITASELPYAKKLGKQAKAIPLIKIHKFGGPFASVGNQSMYTATWVIDYYFQDESDLTYELGNVNNNLTVKELPPKPAPS